MSIYYQDELVTLHHGDCIDVLAEMHDELPPPPATPQGEPVSRGASGGVVDIVVTSPPYNMGLTPGGNGRGMYATSRTSKGKRFADGYGAHRDAMPQADYDRWQRDVLGYCWDIARLAVFYNHRPRIEHGILRDPLSNNFGIPLRQRIIWNRKTGIDVNLRAFCTRAEYVYLFAKPEFKLISHAASAMGDVWDLGIEYRMPDHPAPFPESLPARCIEATGAQSVLDPFAGSGTTLLAARNLGIQSIGVELEERYCEIIARRLDQGCLDFGEVTA